MKTIPLNAIKFVTKFFADLDKNQREYLPPILKSPGRWTATYDNTTLGIFFLNKSAIKRVTEYQNNGWQAFPGFLINEKQKPPGAPVAIMIGGSCNYFSSNHTSNIFAFCVQPGASFTVIDHFHEIRDSSGKEFKYRVDLAYVLGIHEGEQWLSVETRLHELLNHRS